MVSVHRKGGGGLIGEKPIERDLPGRGEEGVTESGVSFSERNEVIAPEIYVDKPRSSHGLLID